MAFRRALWILALSLLALTACSKSTDTGDGNSPATEFQHIHGVAVDSAGVVWVGTHNGLVRSQGNGWVAASSSDHNDYMGFAHDPASGTFYRSGHPPSGGSLGFEASGDGKTWRQVSGVLDPPVDFHAMTLSYAEPKVLYGWDSQGRGLYRTKDAGETWEQVSTIGVDGDVLALAGTATAGEVYAGTSSGMFRSASYGGAWAPVKGLAAGWVSAIAADPTDARHAIAYTAHGLVSTSDGGASWSHAHAQPPVTEAVAALAISSLDPKVIYAAEGTSIFRSADAGATWETVRAGA